jgi:iron complex outermembrane receptor protein
MSFALAALSSALGFGSPEAVVSMAETDQDRVTQLGEVVVTGQRQPRIAGDQVSRGVTLGAFGDRDLFETPVSLKSFTETFIADQIALNSNELISRDASFVVTNSANLNGATAGRLRGFRMEPFESSYDGFSSISGRRYPLEMLERVDVLKGPTAVFTNVVGGVGGTISYVSKKPTEAPLTRLTAIAAGGSVFGGQADVSRRFGADDQFGIRANFARREGETVVNDIDEETYVAHIAFNWRGERFSWDLQYGDSYERLDGAASGYFYNPGVPIGRAPGGADVSGPAWDFREYQDRFLRSALQVELSPNWSAFLVGGAVDSDELFLGLTPAVTGADGTSDSFVFVQQGVSDWDDFWNVDAGLRGRLVTGPVGHGLTLSASRQFVRFNATDIALDPTYVQPIFNIYDPDSYETTAGPAVTGGDNVYVFQETTTDSVVLADELSMLDDRLRLTLGVRYTSIEIASFNYGAPTPGGPNAVYEGDDWSPSVAVLYKVAPNVSIYANALTAFERGQTAPLGAVNAGEQLPPGVSEQVEAGIKVDFGRFGATAAIFDITRPSAYVDPTTLVFGEYGEQRHRGLELDLFGEPIDGVRVLASYAYLDATIEEALDPAALGDRPISVPDHVFTAGIDADVPMLPGLAVQASVRYVGDQAYDLPNDRFIPDFTTFDLGARYAFTAGETPVTARLVVSNVADENYFQSTDFTAQPGAPRTVRFSLTADF